MNLFNREYTTMFLGVVRKYMQVRGGLSQKDLAELVEVGVSTMSRFLNERTKDLDPQLIAKIVAKLDVPLHEIIDFVDEDYTDKFKKLVEFFKDEQQGGRPSLSGDPRSEATQTTSANVRVGKRSITIPYESSDKTLRDGDPSFQDKLARLSPRQKAYISDFLNLDVEGRDLVVDLGNSLFRYFKQKGVDF